MKKLLEISKSVIKREGRYLVLKRAMESKSFPGLWDFAGGKHDPGETSSESVIRETKEETNYDIKPGREIKTEEYHDDQFDILFHFFEPQVIGGELELSHDHSEYKWLTPEEISDLDLHPAVKLYFE